LNRWTPELAEKLIDQLEAYPESLSSFARGEDDSGYYAAFEPAILVLREALLRFPSAEHANDWHWRLAYNLARTSHPEAGATFATLITQALNTGEVQAFDLTTWGLSQRPQAAIETISLDTPPGYLSSSLVKVSAAENGSAFFWLLEKPVAFQAYPLSSDFDFIHPTSVNYWLGDLTGEGSQEAVIFRNSVPGSFRYPLPRVFSFDQEPPRELGFAPASPPEIGPDFTSSWQGVTGGQDVGDLELVAEVFPPCPVTIRHRYAWNGTAFEFRQADYQLAPEPQLLNYCSLVIEHAANVWGLGATVNFMEMLLPDWPPQTGLNGNPLPVDALDEWRYRLAIYQALLGKEDLARSYANAILENPAVPESSWVGPAADFLAAFESPRQIYLACLIARFCDLRRAFEQLVSTFTAEDFSRAPQALAEGGITMHVNGFFDFDNDGETERWVVFKHRPEEKLEFWILAQTESGIQAIFASLLETEPGPISYVGPEDPSPVVQIAPDILVRMVRSSAGAKAELQLVTLDPVFSVEKTEEQLDLLEADLLAGGDPAQARDLLVDLEGQSFFTCSYQLCPRFFYLLGLAHELAGDEELAVLDYLELWREFLGHPLVTGARFKLAGPAILPGPTLTPTRTVTPRPTAFRTFTPTPTLTVTITPSLTWTPTVTRTPTETLTATFTQTNGP
jgi:hypothetical protein